MGTRAGRWLLLAMAVLAGCSDRRSEPAGDPAPEPATAPPDPLLAIRWSDAPLDWKRPVPATPAGGLAEPGYAGSAACRDCHRKIYDRYAGHAMARTGLRPLATLDRDWLAAIFDAGAGAPVSHPGGFAYRPVRDGDRYYVDELLLDGDGQAVQTWRQPVTHALSAGDYGLALYFAQGSRLWHVPIDYFARNRRWGLDPFAAHGNPRFFSPLGRFCISCHGDYPRRQAGAEGSFREPLPAGVGCERCHGPGARHVDSMAAEDLVDLGALPPLRQVEVCTQCHLESGSIARAGRHEFSFRPGEPLSAYRVNFLPEPAEPDRVPLLAHSERMVRSACWTGSGRTMTCTSCHDPHTSSAGQPDRYWDQRCQTCHAEHPCTERPAARARVGDHCAGCHMRTGPAAEVPQVTVTDHWIQTRPPPVRAGPAPVPERLITWAELVGDPVAGDDLAAVAAAGHQRAGLRDRALALSLAAVARRPQVRQLYNLIAGQLKDRRRLDLAAKAYAEVLRFDPDERSVLVNYAMAMLDLGRMDEAGRAIDRLLALDPQDQRALELQGMVLLRAGDVDRARPVLERAANVGPAGGSARAGLAALALRAGQRQVAIGHLEVARRIEPGDAWVLDRLAAAYREAGDGTRAAEIADVRRRLTDMGRPPTSTGISAWLPAGWR